MMKKRTAIFIAQFVITLFLYTVSATNILAVDSIYSTIQNTNNANELIQYLHNNPNSKYYNEVSNRVADLLSQQYTVNTYPDDLLSVLQYATDEETKMMVQQRIDAIFEAKRKLVAQQKSKDRTNIGVNVAIDRSNKNLGLEFGPTIRFGRYTDWINVSVGVNYYFNTGIDVEQNLKGHYITIPIMLKANLIPIGNFARLHIGAGLEWANRLSSTEYKYPDGKEKEVYAKKQFQFNAVFGAQGRKWTIELYYKQAIDDYSLFGYNVTEQTDIKNKIGLRIAYYFKN